MSKIQRVTANTEGNDYICGDIHGCWDRLEERLVELQFDKTKDRMFCVGDLCDRGPLSELALEYLAHDWFFSIFGNHEELLCRAADEVANPTGKVFWERVLIQNGGHWANHKMLAEFDVEFRKLPFAIELELANGKTVGLVHAQITTPWDYVAMRLEDLPSDHYQAHGENFLAELLWGRDKIENLALPTVVDGIDHVFHGHTIVGAITTKGNCSYIDTGCFATNKLTVVNPNDYV